MIFVKQQVTSHQTRALLISGHALSAEHGKDLICAAVSGISIGLLNAIDTLCPNTCDLSMESGLIEIRVNDWTKQLEWVLSVGLIQLEMVAQSHPEYVEFLKEEV